MTTSSIPKLSNESFENASQTPKNYPDETYPPAKVVSSTTVRLVGFNIRVFVEKQNLVLQDGYGENKQTVVIYASNPGITDVIMPTWSGSISFDAISWIAEHGVRLAWVDKHNNLVGSIVPPCHLSPIIKQTQANLSECERVSLAKPILVEKINNQIATLQWLSTKIKNHATVKTWSDYPPFLPYLSGASQTIGETLTNLTQADTLDGLRIVEANAAKVYWQVLKDIPIRLKGPIPSYEWKTLGQRTSPKTSSPRKAVTPFHASLNYAYTMLATMAKQVVMDARLDEDFPILHELHSNRPSLIYDVIEPLRPTIDCIVLSRFVGHTIATKDFFYGRDGTCRLMPNTLSWTTELETCRPTLVAVVKRLAKDIKDIAANH